MPVKAPDTVSRNALVILATIAGGVVLYVLADILTPLALALFLAVMIDGFARVLQGRLAGVSARAAKPLAIALSVPRGPTCRRTARPSSISASFQ